MARTLEEVNEALSRLEVEVELLKQERLANGHPIRQLAGLFTDDPDWTALHEGIERKREVPDPELTGS